jgi:hypothetical protein
MEYTPLQRAYLWHRRADESNLRRNARLALDFARRDVAAGTRRYPPPDAGCAHAGTWQRPEDMKRYATARDRAYYSDAFPFPEEPNSDRIKVERWRDLEDGWYTDPDVGETMRGHVLRLRTPEGLRFVPGVSDSGSDGVTCYPLDWHETAEDAARAADRYAEISAEAEREYREAWRFGERAANLKTEAAAIRGGIIATVSDLRAARRAVGTDAPESVRGILADSGAAMARLCAKVRAEVQRELNSLYDLRTRRDALVSEWGSADGFGDGYGEAV